MFRFHLVLLVLVVSLFSLVFGIVLDRHSEARTPMLWLSVLAQIVFIALALVWANWKVVSPFQRELDRLKKLEEEGSGLYNHAPCGHHSLDADGKFIRINDTALAWLGHTREEVIGRPITDFLSPQGKATFNKGFGRFPAHLLPARLLDGLLSSEQIDNERGWVRDVELQMVRKDGTPLFALLSSQIVRGADGRPLFSRGTFVDITERKKASEQLHRLAMQAEAANQAKSQFLANMSHEIRTPLTGIIGMAEVLFHSAVNEQQKGQLLTLSRAADALLELITDVLDISKIEAGKLELEHLEFDVRDLVEDAATVVRLTAERKGVALRCDLSPSLPAKVMGDPGRLRQVLLNLLSNAVKFTDHGEIVVRGEVEKAFTAENADRRGFTAESAERRGEREDTREDPRQAPPSGSLSSSALSAVNGFVLRFEVSDTGVGIAPEKQSRIFEPFAQADSSTMRTHGGTGLGLTIAARLVERLGGCLTLPSEVGVGSCFRFSIPLVVEPTLRFDRGAGEESARTAPLIVKPGGGGASAKTGSVERQLSVLLVEDNVVNQEVITLQMKKAGCRVELARNGIEALAAFERGTFDLILMDVQMPEMDGLRATRLIRAREKAIGGHIPIVAVTANAMQGEKERCLAAGMDEYLPKPVRGPELSGVINRLFGQSILSPHLSTDSQEGQEWLPALVNTTGFSHEDISKLAQTFIDVVPGRLIQLQQAVAQGCVGEVESVSHLLKGSLSVFSAHKAVEAAQALELMGRSRDLTTGGQEVLVLLQAEVWALLSSLKNFLLQVPHQKDSVTG